MEKPERFYGPTQALSLIVCSGSPIEFRSLYSRIGRNPQECAAHRVTRFPSQTVEQAANVVAATREKYRATLRPLRPGAHTMARHGLNGERACGASLEPRGGEPKKSPRQNHATAWGRKPRAPEYASNDAKSSQIDCCVLDWPKRHRPPSIISEGRKGDSFVLRKNRAKFASKRKSVDRTNGATRSPSARRNA